MVLSNSIRLDMRYMDNIEVIQLIRKYPQIHNFNFAEYAIRLQNDAKGSDFIETETHEYLLIIYGNHKGKNIQLKTIPKKGIDFREDKAVEEIDILLAKEILEIDLKDWSDKQSQYQKLEPIDTITIGDNIKIKIPKDYKKSKILHKI